VLQRKHVQADSVIYIGREANNIDEQELDVKKTREFLNKKEIIQNILALPQKQAEEWGVDRKTFQRIKKRIHDNGDIKLNTVAVKKLVNK
jgi:RNase H-fold protein (predicted Holliday junction resolvase)